MDIKGNRIIAVDFDGTLHTGTWPEIGDVNMTVFNFCRNEQLNGARLILWTNRAGEQLEDAVAWCKERGLEFDAVNENLPEVIELYGNDCRKINADIYIDDKAVNPMRRRQIAGLTSLNPYDNPTIGKRSQKPRNRKKQKERNLTKMKKLKRILKAISRRKRQERLKRNYKKYSLQIPRLMKSETIMELDFAAGYLIGQFEAAYEYGELSEKQHDELTQIVNYIHEGQREKKENE